MAQGTSAPKVAWSSLGCFIAQAKHRPSGVLLTAVCQFLEKLSVQKLHFVFVSPVIIPVRLTGTLEVLCGILEELRGLIRNLHFWPHSLISLPWQEEEETVSWERKSLCWARQVVQSVKCLLCEPEDLRGLSITQTNRQINNK